MLKKFYFILAGCIIFCCASCAATGELHNISVDPREFSNPAQTITVAQGDNFSIVLDSNATTGYSWNVAGQPSRVALKSHRYEPPQTSLTGAGGREHYEFTAKSTGKESLTFRYARPWEKDIPPVKTVTFIIEVKSKE